MRFSPALGGFLALSICLFPVTAFAQSLATSGSPLPDQPYTLTYPDVMVTSGELGGPLTINHPTLPLQCVLTVVPIEDTGWTPEGALAELDPDTIAAGWSETFPQFVLGQSMVTRYQSNPALQYEGTSPGSEEGGAITLVHTETVEAQNGYTLDCFYASAVAAEARPLVDTIIANFSTQQAPQPTATP